MSLFDDNDKEKFGNADFELGNKDVRRGGGEPASPFGGVEEPKKKRGFRRRKKDDSEQFALGRDDSGKPASPFGDALTVNGGDEIVSEKEAKKRRKGKSSLSLGAKYGGKRKVFLILMAVLGVVALLTLYNTYRSTTSVNKGQLKSEVSKAVDEKTGSAFPTGLGAMRLDAFVRVYGTWDYKTQAGRGADLSQFLAPGVDPQAGWDGKGTQQVIYSAVSPTPKIVDKNRAVYDATYQIQDGTWRCVKIPVYAYKPSSAAQGPIDQWTFSVTANPVAVPCSLPVSVPNFDGNQFTNKDDKAAAQLAQNFFPGFFSAWATSDADTLTQYMAPNVTTFGLGGAYQANPKIVDVVLPVSNGEETAQPDSLYNAYVTVQFTDKSGSSVTSTYKVPVSYTGTRWQVRGEPEAVVQDLTVGGSSAPVTQGKDTSGDAEQKNTYPTPQNGSQSQPEDQKATTPQG